LETNINIISESENEITITLTPEEIQADLEVEIEKQTRNIQIDGFRKGKAPKNVIKQIYRDSLEIQAAEKFANKKFWEIVDEKNIKPIGEPVITDFNYKSGENFTYKVKYEVLPNIQVKDYKNLTIEIPESKLDEKEIDEEIEKILLANAEKVEADTITDNFYSLVVDVYSVDENQNENLVQQNVAIDLFNKNINKEII
jgi:trigger factor